MVDFLFVVLILSLIVLLFAVLTAMIGIFGKKEERNKHLELSAKTLLWFALLFLVGFGGCLTIM